MRIVWSLVLILASPASACLWDSDTLSQEAAGRLDVQAIIVGGFARNPAKYYEMRLERVARQLASAPKNLDAYDDAAVACDRLGRPDEAIEWMRKKLAEMDRAVFDSKAHAQPNHRYRYFANLGTFYAHRWFKSGAKRDEMGDLKRGRELIAKAIEENPDAHFGREKYQLVVMDWVIADKVFGEPFTGLNGEERRNSKDSLPNIVGLVPDMLMRITDSDEHLDRLKLKGAIEGLAGLVALGAAWESVDVFYALALVLQASGRSSMAALAYHRCAELVTAGRGSIVTGAPSGDKLLKVMHGGLLFMHRLYPNDRRLIEDEFRQQRSRADVWHDERVRYMLERFARGEHPDTHPEFWLGFSGDPHRLDLSVSVLHEIWTEVRRRPQWFILGLIPIAILAYIMSNVRRRRRQRAGIPEPVHQSFRLTR